MLFTGNQVQHDCIVQSESVVYLNRRVRRRKQREWGSVIYTFRLSVYTTMGFKADALNSQSLYTHVCPPVQWKEHEREQMEEENRRILEFSRQQQVREGARMEEAKKQEQAMAAVQQKVRFCTFDSSHYSLYNIRLRLFNIL